MTADNRTDQLRQLLVRLAKSPWRSPADQPRWARPILVLVASLAGVAYGWGMDNDVLESFYGAAARSMSSSWRSYFFGAFDPSGTVTIDKLPGELWVQALLLRVTGFHTWAIVLPQVLEGALSVLILYRAVRRLSGPLAAIVAAIVLAVSPVTVLLNRGNVSDSLLILLLLLAVDAACKAISTGSSRALVFSGLWIGLAFQAKMLEAWIAIPAIGLAYLISSTRSARERALALAAFSLVAVLVSLSWMTVVSVIPAHDRPYVDASRNDSEFQQVFLYNGFTRLSHQPLGASLGTQAPYIAQSKATDLNFATNSIQPAWDRLLGGPFGQDDGWLLPAVVLALFALGLRSHKASPTVRAGLSLWAGWFILLFVAFSTSQHVNSYYVAALSPPEAALVGMGFAAAYEKPSNRRSRAWIALGVSAVAVYGLFLIPARAGVHDWLVPTALVIAAGADLVLLLPRSFRDNRVATGKTGLVLALASVLFLPLIASISVVSNGLGPFDSPYEPTSVTTVTQVDARSAIASAEGAVSVFDGWFASANSVVATESSGLAQLPIFVTGREFLPIGGLLGAGPSPSLRTLKNLVASGRLGTVLAAVRPANPDPRFVWLRRHCQLTQQLSSNTANAPIFGLYACSP